MMVQSLLRHAMSEAISEGFINCLIVTSSAETNIQLSRIHEHLFARKCFVTLRTFRISCSTPLDPLLPVPRTCAFFLSQYPYHLSKKKTELIKFK